MGGMVLDDLPKFIDVLTEKYKVYAPVEQNGTILFKQIKKSSEISFCNSIVPPKALLFPQTETLFKFTLGKGEIEVVESKDEKVIIFGIRPCDARAFTILDYVFKDDYEDPYYLKKRKNTILIGLSCTQPTFNCFCTSFDDGPTSSKHVDILLTEIGGRYYVDIESEKGKQLSKHFKPASKEESKKREEVERGAINTISRHQKTNGIVERLDKIFEDQFWERVAMKCIGCGICTYLCPTCHCFDIQDEATLSEGARIRVWDTCMNPEYTLQASGYNPRPARMNRVRNRIYHKYNYYPKNFGVIACVGCGRCIDNCPVNIDVIDVVARAMEVRG
jgi:ferredoxin